MTFGNINISTYNLGDSITVGSNLSNLLYISVSYVIAINLFSGNLRVSLILFLTYWIIKSELTYSLTGILILQPNETYPALNVIYPISD